MSIKVEDRRERKAYDDMVAGWPWLEMGSPYLDQESLLQRARGFFERLNDARRVLTGELVAVDPMEMF